MKRVGICAFAQTTVESNKWDQRFQEMAWEVVEKLLDETSLDFSDNGIEIIISVSDDVFDARTISDNAMTDVLGAILGVRKRCLKKGFRPSIMHVVL